MGGELAEMQAADQATRTVYYCAALFRRDADDTAVGSLCLPEARHRSQILVRVEPYLLAANAAVKLAD